MLLPDSPVPGTSYPGPSALLDEPGASPFLAAVRAGALLAAAGLSALAAVSLLRTDAGWWAFAAVPLGLFGVWAGAVVLRRGWRLARSLHRQARGRCPHCGHEISHPRCPECGQSVFEDLPGPPPP